MLSFYEHQLIFLTGFCILSLLLERRFSNQNHPSSKETSESHLENGRHGPSNSMASLTRQYLVVYAIVMGQYMYYFGPFYSFNGLHAMLVGADWLQGPYVYSLYREQYDFPERIVAVLFVTGFMSAGLTAPLIGVWADQQ
jgi:hypothetical protein